ncbi:hypothetical protein C2G38_718524 [Gigaspora rosea]|uniref:Trypsin-like cysteine/serine peptidase domain-containing protein n=1 Tax=Gigaspora rosea TaxID=44941 RepID=A0A397U1A2_9GLOM|nr:hypothetical protein C2G38_718524 [Gigaspora rosea]
MIIIHYLVKLLLFSLIFMSQNYLTVQQSRRILSLKPLAEYWNVPLNDVPKLLIIERILSNTTRILTPLLHQYNESFGGSYIDVKKNLVFINTIDFSKEQIIRSSPILKNFENLLKFIPANYSTHQLESSFNSLGELINRTDPVNIIMGISSFYNRIVIDLNHSDDKENEAFLNATVPFEQFIFMNYLSDNNSLSLRSTSDSPISRPHTKRFLERYFLAGEGLVTSDNGQLAVRCSAGFSAIDNTTYQKYLITSARCLLNESNRAIYHAPWEQPLQLNETELDHFGNIVLLQRTSADFALIEKFSNNFKLTPMMRSSVEQVQQVIIDKFNNGGFEIPEGHLLCICGYQSHIKCGPVTLRGAEVTLKSVRVDKQKDHYYNMLKANIIVSNVDVGGTVYSIEIPGDGPNEGVPLVVVHGIVSAKLRRGGTAIQPLSGMTSFSPTSDMFARLRFIDLGIFRQLQL